MKFKSLLLVVGFIPALAMAEVAKSAPEKAPPVGARPAVVTHVYHHHYHYHVMPGMMPPHAIHHYYQSGPPKISKPAMEGGAREQNYATENPQLWGSQSGAPQIPKPTMEGQGYSPFNPNNIQPVQTNPFGPQAPAPYYFFPPY